MYICTYYMHVLCAMCIVCVSTMCVCVSYVCEYGCECVCEMHAHVCVCILFLHIISVLRDFLTAVKLMRLPCHTHSRQKVPRARPVTSNSRVLPPS